MPNRTQILVYYDSATYAQKCRYRETLEDAYGLYSIQRIQKVMSSLRTMLCTLWRLIRIAMLHIRLIVWRTGIQIEKNRRNGQKQSDHLEETRTIRDIRMRRQGR